MKITFTQDEIDVICKYAEEAELGGKSNVRFSGEERRSYLKGDQMTAQLGEAALCKLFTGNISLYEKTRRKRNENKWKGDDGSDLIGFSVDVKTSRARRGMDFPYNLWIREREYNPETSYILAIIPEEGYEVSFLGWKKGSSIRYKNGDRYEVNKKDLSPMSTFSCNFTLDK